MSCSLPRRCHGPTRRRFLEIGSSGVFGLGLAGLLRAESCLPVAQQRAKNVIFIWLNGGPSTIDMWDPKPEAPAEIRGEFGTIATSLPGVQFTEQMPQTAALLDRCVLLRGLCHNIPDHVPGSQYVMTGNMPAAALEHPSLGSLAANLVKPTQGMPPYFAVGTVANAGAGFLGSEHDPFRVGADVSNAPEQLEGVVLPASMTLNQLKTRRRIQDVVNASFTERRADVDLVPTLDRFQQEASAILASNRIGEAFDLEGESEATRELYGPALVGRNALIARRLIEAGARFVTVGVDGWDTHTGNFAALRGLLPPLDRALAGLIADLDQRGLLGETVVVCGGEFGRTPLVNGNAGRDHWSRAMTYLLAGGGLKRGYVHGATDPRGHDPIDGDCAPDDLGATLLSLLGFPPDHQVHTASGRPIDLFKLGRTLDEVIA